MKAYMPFTETLKQKLDKIFTENPETSFEQIVDRFTEKFEEVPHIGYMPADEAENAYEIYGDRVGFMMGNYGQTPEEFYVQHFMSEDTAKAIVQLYKSENGTELTLKDFAYYLYRHNALCFSNVYKDYHLVQLSPKHIIGKTARNYVTVSKLHKPRYFQVCYRDNKISRCKNGAYADILQPDNRKNEYICIGNVKYLVLNCSTIIRY